MNRAIGGVPRPISLATPGDEPVHPHHGSPHHVTPHGVTPFDAILPTGIG
jgi:hypothetical protein